ncbi:Uncharacterised protein [Enterococcus casseliflavus]|jgi:hypothetical protein|nr:hypothetical protein ECA02_18130 [Enterococcus casseliflavus]STP32848.1 Uncharacterised protein [Enterococcus casseliflavus]
MTLKKSIIWGTTIWAILFIITGFMTLFQINETTSVTTLLGLKISTVFSDSELNTTFTLTYKVIFGLLVINLLTYIIFYIMRKKK